MNKNKKILMITSIIMIILICIAFTHRSFQNDTFYTIKIGQSILKNGIDMKDHFSWHNLPYTYPHWLYDIIVYKIYKVYDFHGLYVFNILVFMVIGISFYFINLRLNKSYFLSLLFSIFGVIMLANYAATRAQLITYLLFILEIYFIERLLSSSKKRYGIFLLIICLLIANLHSAVWPFYFILMIPFFVENIVYKLKNRFNIKLSSSIFNNKLIIEDNSNIKFLFIIFVISLFLGLVTPTGGEPYTYFIKILQGNTMEYIEEHKPLILIRDAFVIGYLFILLVSLIFTKVKIKLSDICMIFGILVMSFMSIRHISFLAIIGIFYLCRIICNIGYINGDEVLDFELPPIGSVIVLISMIFTSIFVYNYNFKQPYINSNVYPVSMVNYMEEHLDMNKVKLYNEYDFGSYLIFRGIDVFIDSRSDLYTKPFNHKVDIFDECMNITRNYGRVFNKYDITHILIYKDNDLSRILSVSDNYKVVHRDDNFILYEYINKEDNE